MFNPSSPCYNSLVAMNSAKSDPERVEMKLTLCFPRNPRFSRIAPRIESTWHPIQPINITAGKKIARGVRSSLIAPRIEDTTAMSNAP